jgi:hypothetical protein
MTFLVGFVVIFYQKSLQKFTQSSLGLCELRDFFVFFVVYFPPQKLGG